MFTAARNGISDKSHREYFMESAHAYLLVLRYFTTPGKKTTYKPRYMMLSVYNMHTETSKAVFWN